MDTWNINNTRMQSTYTERHSEWIVFLARTKRPQSKCSKTSIHSISIRWLSASRFVAIIMKWTKCHSNHCRSSLDSIILRSWLVCWWASFTSERGFSFSNKDFFLPRYWQCIFNGNTGYSTISGGKKSPNLLSNYS